MGNRFSWVTILQTDNTSISDAIFELYIGFNENKYCRLFNTGKYIARFLFIYIGNIKIAKNCLSFAND